MTTMMTRGDCRATEVEEAVAEVVLATIDITVLVAELAAAVVVDRIVGIRCWHSRCCC